MARDFTKNTANYMSLGVNALGALLNGASIISVSMWIQADTLTATANNNRLFSVYNFNGNTALTFLTDATSHLRVGGRSNLEGFQFKDSTTAIATGGAWTHCGGVYNIGGDTITPYLNGVAEGGGAVTFSAATWTNAPPTTTNDIIGGDAATAGGGPTAVGQQIDGRLAEFAVWVGVDIGAANMRLLSQQRGGKDLLRIHRASLVYYLPLYGDASPEPAIIGTPVGTITGTVAAAAHLPYSGYDQAVGL